MATAAKKVSEGDLSTKVKVDSNDDLRLLADNFNEMTERVNDLFNEVKRRKEELRSIISSLKEGILVLGINGKIKLCNRAFLDEFSTDANSEEDLRKIPYENIFAPSEKIARMIKNTLETKNGNTKELSYNNKDYLVSTVFIPARKEVSVTFHNITEMKRLNELKKDFVTNASHELKTPLTSLKGYLETMATDQELNNEQQRYIQIMNRNTLRMINLVDDLLILSELEQKTDLQLEKIDLAEVVEETVSLFNENAQAKDITIENQLVKDYFMIKGDYFKLEQIFINLIDNSIKYSESGTIKISATLEDNKVILKIADCGIGIPDDVKDRIFERFFVVNKSRSRESGGTGLGLSIVKHIIQSHQGTIFVEDNQPRGTIFKIILPLAT
jgi:two-component system phosphate regulon sensor histidine kinase PhoR